MILHKNLKNAYSGFIPPNLTEMAVSWAKKNVVPEIKLKAQRVMSGIRNV
jgi:hypothetical protein